jgi:hypothetical protein
MLLHVSLWLACLWFGTVGMFFACVKARELHDSGELREHTAIMRTMFLLAAVFVVVDVAFNWTWGTYLYREFPRELLFSARTKRHLRDTSGRSRVEQKRTARKWAEILNMVDRGHV